MHFNINGTEIMNRAIEMYSKRVSSCSGARNVAAAIVEILLFVLIVMSLHVFANVIAQSILLYIAWSMAMTPLFGIPKATFLQCILMWCMVDVLISRVKKNKN